MHDSLTFFLTFSKMSALTLEEAIQDFWGYELILFVDKLRIFTSKYMEVKLNFLYISKAQCLQKKVAL